MKFFVLSLAIFISFSAAANPGSKEKLSHYLAQMKEAQIEKDEAKFIRSLDSIIVNLVNLGHYEEAFRVREVMYSGQLMKRTAFIAQQERMIANALAYCMIPVLTAFLFFAFVIYRNRRELLFRKREAEIELKALRSQMNPHFIFNSLNSIYLFMNSNRMKEAGDYLISFSKLIRNVLENSVKHVIPLSAELQMLTLYIELEQLRLNRSFNYRITIDESIDEEETFIPPLMLQPVVENAIWHGLHHLPSDGLLTITITKNDTHTIYNVIDNGRSTSAKTTINNLKDLVSSKSLATQLIEERLDQINRYAKIKAEFSRKEIKDSEFNYIGSDAELKLPVN